MPTTTYRLEKGDVVQTGSEGMAKVVFNDGTNYTVKQDSLIVIEENSANDQQQTHVAVAVTSGTVDLSTATYSQGSKSQVIVAGADGFASHPESAAMVHNDPKSDQHEILVKNGSGDVSRNGETVRLADWERATFKAKSEKMAKIKEIGPPTPDLAGKHDSAFLFGGHANQGRTVHLDGHDERRWIPAAHLAQSHTFRRPIVDRPGQRGAT